MKNLKFTYNDKGRLDEIWEDDAYYVAAQEEKALSLSPTFPAFLAGNVRAYIEYKGGGALLECGKINLNSHTVTMTLDADYLVYDRLKVGFEVHTEKGAQIRFQPITLEVDEFVNITGTASGKNGYTVTVKIGAVAELAPGEAPYVENVGSDKDVVLSFGIPRGEKPILGEDYWTPEEQEEIKSEILDVILPEIEQKQPLDFVVNVTTSGTVNVGDYKIESVDKTYAEILDEYNAGRRVSLLLDGIHIVPLCAVKSYSLEFRTTQGVDKLIVFSVTVENTWKVRSEFYYTAEEIDTELDNKADKGTTLAEYGITDAYQKQNLVSIEEGKIDIGGGNPFASTIIKDGSMRVGALYDTDDTPYVIIQQGTVNAYPGDESERAIKLDYNDVTLVTPGKTHNLSEKADTKDVDEKLADKQPLDFVVNVTTMGSNYETVIESTDKTFEEVLEAHNAGKRVYLLVNKKEIAPMTGIDTSRAIFARIGYAGEKTLQFDVSQSGWFVSPAPDPTYLEIEELIRDGDYNVTQELLPKINAKADARDVVALDTSARNTYANALKKTVSGVCTVSMDDVSPVPHDVAVEVKSENILPYPYSFTTKTINGVLFTDNGNGSITVSGTSTHLAIFRLFADVNAPLPGVVKGKTYVCSGNSNNVTVSMTYYKEGETSSVGWLSGNGVAKATPEDMQGMYCYISVPAGVTVDETVYPKLQEGSTATPYTPYVDVSKTKLTATGKNIVDVSQAVLGKKLQWGASPGTPLAAHATDDKAAYILHIPVKGETTYTFSLDNSVYWLNRIIEFDANDLGVFHYPYYYTNTDKATYTITTQTTTAWVGVDLSNKNETAATAEDLKNIHLQIERGEKVSPYESYSAETYMTNTDGTADITSVSPTMTVFTDNAGAIIDLEYNPDITKAMENVNADLRKLKEEWRLINEVELTEDAVVEFTADADGNAFNLKKFKVTVLMPKLETQSQVWLAVFTSSYFLAVYSESIPTTVTYPAVSVSGELTYAWQFETCYSKSGLSNSGTVTSFPRGSRYTTDITGLVSKVKLGFNSGMTTPLPAGSTIKLWGCE